MKYFEAGNTLYDETPKTSYKRAYQEAVNQLFYNSSDWETIEEETSYASGTYTELDVRINNVVFARTGMPQGDDYKVILFKDIDHPTSLGRYYKFEDNYWVVVNIMSKPSLQTSVVVRRCNNVLKWVTEDGAYFEYPCALHYGIKENRDYSTAGSEVVSPSGLLTITTQLNAYTNTIIPNQRFLFGNSAHWTAYKVMGGGVENFNNLSTTNNEALTGYLRLTLNADYINEQGDDLTNGIANYNENVYTLELSSSTISGNPSDTIQLYAEVTWNGQTVSRNLTWSTSDENIATVSTSGLVTFIADGSCTITCTIANNSTVSDTCGVTVTTAPVSEYQVVITPNQNYVLEGIRQTFTVELYLNSVLQADAFSFTLVPGTVPSDNYVYTVIDGNSFSIQNVEKYLSDTLTVNCVSGVHSSSIDVELRGGW